MALRHDPARLLLAAGVLCGGLVLGRLAGIDPRLAIVGSIACAYVLLTFADLSLGLAFFIILSFVEALSAGGVALSVTKL